MDIIETKIKGFEKYTINIFGEIKNIKTGRILKNTKNSDGYYKTALSQNGVMKYFKIHRLIAQHFLPNPGNKPIVDHKDNDKKNNSIDNLRWSSNQENCRNTVKQKNTSSIYKGVSWYAKSKKWRAQICNKTKIRLGYYLTEEEAGKAYDKYIIDHNLQEFLKLNF